MEFQYSLHLIQLSNNLINNLHPHITTIALSKAAQNYINTYIAQMPVTIKLTRIKIIIITLLLTQTIC